MPLSDAAHLPTCPPLPPLRALFTYTMASMSPSSIASFGPARRRLHINTEEFPELYSLLPAYEQDIAH